MLCCSVLFWAVLCVLFSFPCDADGGRRCAGDFPGVHVFDFEHHSVSSSSAVLPKPMVSMRVNGGAALLRASSRFIAAASGAGV
jgi:hypothetical protein